MYCPRCGQQQVSDEMRFCSRCGFALGVVRELLAGGGELVRREAEAQVAQPSPALKGMRKGVWIMLSGVPLTIMIGLLTAVNDAFAVLLLLPFLCFVVGFVRLLYGTFFQDHAPRVKSSDLQPHVGSAAPVQTGAGARGPEWSALRGAPVEGFAPQRLKTAEMSQPPSVTESSTRLLDEEANLERG